jgi:hypothetical protein
MSKARLVKKEDIRPEMMEPRKKSRRARKTPPRRNAVEVTTEWIKARREETPSPRQAFQALFGEPETQSA